MNSVNLVGNISTDIDLRYTPNGKAVATFNIAVNNPYNREKTAFLPIEVWEKSGENTANYCSKGSKVGITGHIEVDQWRKMDRNSKTKIVADTVKFLTPKGSNTQKRNKKNIEPSDPFKDGGEDIDDSDMPF